jgi:hypothetical protein
MRNPRDRRTDRCAGVRVVWADGGGDQGGGGAVGGRPHRSPRPVRSAVGVALVYELYGLTKEEVKVVEGGRG